MKTLLLAFIGAGMALASSNARVKTESAGAVIWKDEVYDFGKIPQGIPDTAVFEFTNSGKVPVVIMDVVKSCGCSSVEFPRDPVKPKRKAQVIVVYNAAAPGMFTKTVSVKFNEQQENRQLTIKGDVVPR